MSRCLRLADPKACRRCFLAMTAPCSMTRQGLFAALALVCLATGAGPVAAQAMAPLATPPFSGATVPVPAALLASAAGAEPAMVGVTQALREARLSLNAAGRVESVMVKEGDRARRGDLLLHLDRSLEELELRRRQVMLDDNSRLDELRRREVTLGEQVVNARNLFESGGVSRKQAEDEELAWQSNVAERKALEIGKLREKFQLDLARQSAVPNEPVLTMVDVSRVRFNGTFPAASMSPLRSGQSVSIRLGMDGGSVLRQTKVIFVSPVTDSASGLVELIAEFDNRDGSVRPGISGQIVAPLASAERRSAAAVR